MTETDRGPGPAVRPEAIRAFLDCSLTHSETWLLWSALGLTLLMQFLHLMPTSAGVALLCFTAIMCWSTPVTAFYFIACAQSLPFPETAQFNPAQIGVLTWPLALIFFRQKPRLRNVWELWPILPMIVWMALVAGEYRTILTTRSEYVKAILYAVIACHYAASSGGRYQKCLLGLSLGALAVVTSFWAKALGLPVQLMEYTGGLSRGGFNRVGAARADSVMVWPPVLMGLFAVIGIAVALSRRHAKVAQARWLGGLSLVLLGVSIPPLVATMTHSAYLGFSMMSVGVMVVLIPQLAASRLTLSAKRKLLRFVLIPLVVAAVAFSTDMFETRSRMVGLWNYYRSNTTGDSSLAASRTDVWRYSIRTIEKHPWLGIRYSGEREEMPGEYRRYGGYLSHNVFLDYGRYGGIPCMLMVIFFFFYPEVRLLRLGPIPRFLGFHLAYFAMFIFWMSLSFQFYKTYWALWMLMTVMIVDLRRYGETAWKELPEPQ